LLRRFLLLLLSLFSLIRLYQRSRVSTRMLVRTNRFVGPFSRLVRRFIRRLPPIPTLLGRRTNRTPRSVRRVRGSARFGVSRSSG
jgi:hypothetical protein